jgi:hypothetical protein
VCSALSLSTSAIPWVSPSRTTSDGTPPPDLAVARPGGPHRNPCGRSGRQHAVPPESPADPRATGHPIGTEGPGHQVNTVTREAKPPSRLHRRRFAGEAKGRSPSSRSESIVKVGVHRQGRNPSSRENHSESLGIFFHVLTVSAGHPPPPRACCGSDTVLGDEGATALSAALPGLQSLKTLRLR